jgi:hypothetical protein
MNSDFAQALRNETQRRTAIRIPIERGLIALTATTGTTAVFGQMLRRGDVCTGGPTRETTSRASSPSRNGALGVSIFSRPCELIKSGKGAGRA